MKTHGRTSREWQPATAPMVEFGACRAGATTLRSAKMKVILLSLLFGFFTVFPTHIATADIEDPFGGVDDNVPDDLKPRVVTEEGRKTLEILRTEEVDAVTLDPGGQKKGFEIIKAKLEKRGVTVRLKHYGDTKSNSQPGGPLALRNIPLDKFMQYFDEWACWGWILYPDGSITYFDNVCCGRWPKDGLYCHDSQYEAGKPDVMAKEHKAATEKPRAEQPGAGQPATRRADKPEGSDKPQPEAEGRRP